MKTIIACISITTLLFLTGCGDPGIPTVTPGYTKEVRLWVAPNEAQESFWKVAVSKWNERGQDPHVTFSTIPATGNSEEAILTALAAANAPDISTNIFPGFAAQLSALDQLEDLAEMEGFDELVASREMEKIMAGWAQNGRQYVFPIYSNPTLIWWRQDLLDELGIKEVPRSFDDVYSLSKKYSVPNKKFGMKVIAGKNWADRWFDFISYYYAASKGAPYIKDGEAAYDNEAGRSALLFMDTMIKRGWTTTDFGSEDPLIVGTAVGAVHGPWDIAYFKKAYPDVLKKITIGPMISEKPGEDKAFTFADTKGLVIFKHTKVKKEAFEFIAWVFSNDALSLLWLEKTGLPPARGDLTENTMFEAFYAANPLAATYAFYVDTAVPSAFIEATIAVQKTMGNEMVEPIELQTKDIDTAIEDAIKRTNKLLRRYK